MLPGGSRIPHQSALCHPSNRRVAVQVRQVAGVGGFVGGHSRVLVDGHEPQRWQHHLFQGQGQGQGQGRGQGQGPGGVRVWAVVGVRVGVRVRVAALRPGRLSIWTWQSQPLTRASAASVWPASENVSKNNE